MREIMFVLLCVGRRAKAWCMGRLMLYALYQCAS